MAVAMLTAIVGLFFAGVADALHASYHKLDASRDGSARNSAHGEPVHAALEPTPMRVHGNSSDAGVDSHRQLRLTSIPTLHNVPRAARDPQATANRLGAFFGPTDPYVGPSEDHWDGVWRYLPSPEEAEDHTTAGSIQRSAARLSVTQPPNADEMCDFGRSLPPDMITLVLTGPSRTERVKAASDTLCLPNLEIVNGVHYSSEDDSTQR
jgi:hypothetical protein